jgi:hypothetical protein
VEVTDQAALSPDTAGAAYTANEQGMLQVAYDHAVKATETLRTLGAWGDP